MSDLISRKAVLDIIQKEIDFGTEYDADYALIDLKDVIAEMPTAYSVEKVVARLEEEKKYCSYHPHTRDEAINKAIEIVNQLAEEHNGGWIPVSERLPEHGGVYIVMIEGAKKTTTLKLSIDGWADEFDNLYKVIAWMPMPPAYVPKGE